MARAGGAALCTPGREGLPPPPTLTCGCGSEASNCVATAQGLGTQGLRAGCLGVLDSAAAAVPVVEPQHMLRNLVVRPEVWARVTTCRAISGHSPPKLREMKARSLSLCQVQAEAT